MMHDAFTLDENPAKRRRCDGGGTATHNTEESSPVRAGTPAALPSSEIEVNPPVATGDQPLLRGANPSHATPTEVDGRRSLRELNLPNSDSVIDINPLLTSRGDLTFGGGKAGRQ
ncbi:hypothetical protein PC116_g27867 [Phytophthora cactorum]|nr:hypothetical protein PC114_g25057 [Phytophthora cactorum]KAG2983882.1 hypothetical protein PC120_g24348 [Phytophthora cactorum]KAG4223669.1 hypothetical protein PC116_g27867 [Phytophthora cactorum]